MDWYARLHTSLFRCRLGSRGAFACRKSVANPRATHHHQSRLRRALHPGIRHSCCSRQTAARRLQTPFMTCLPSCRVAATLVWYCRPAMRRYLMRRDRSWRHRSRRHRTWLHRTYRHRLTRTVPMASRYRKACTCASPRRVTTATSPSSSNSAEQRDTCLRADGRYPGHIASAGETIGNRAVAIAAIVACRTTATIVAGRRAT